MSGVLRLIRGSIAVAVALLPAAALAGILILRATDTPVDPRVGATLTADQRLDLAADTIVVAMARGGAGFTFTVVSRSTLVARAGGPKIEIPDPTDPSKVASLADSYYIGASIASGAVTPDGYWIQMRRGPDSATGAPDFVAAEPTLAALVRAGVIWRNDGAGWYVTDIAPAIGLDPATIARLPKLLREAGGPSLAGAFTTDSGTLTKVSATGSVANAPGLIAVDLERETVLVAPMEFGLDDAGHLAWIHARLRNTNESTFDLIVDVTITITYPTSPPSLPDPVPTIDPNALSAEAVR